MSNQGNADGQFENTYLSSFKGSVHFSVLRIQLATTGFAENYADQQRPTKPKVYRTGNILAGHIN